MKNIQKIITIAAFGMAFLILVPLVRSQEGHGGRATPEQKEKLKAHKIAFITERLQLTPAEAEKFWPVYNEHEATMETMHKEFRKAHNFEPEDLDAMNDAEVNAFIEDQLKQDQQMLDQRKAFIGKLKTVIPSRKILMLIEAEKDFRVEVVRKVSGKDGPPMPHDQERMAHPEKK